MASRVADAQSYEQLAGVWRIEKPLYAARTIDGKEPPLRPEAAKKYREYIAARKQGDSSFDSATWCASVGMPRIMFIDSPFEIIADPPYVAFMHEWNWWARVVYMEGALFTAPAAIPASGSGPPSGGRMLDPSAARDLPGPMGLSEGHWEGDALVVETTHLVDLTLIDSAGLPHSDNLKLTERLKLRSPNVLENRIRIEDPTVFTQPWETLVTYRRQRNVNIKEDVCLDRIQDGSPAVKRCTMSLRMTKRTGGAMSGLALVGMAYFAQAESADGTSDARDFAGMWRRVTVPRDPSDFIISADLPYKPEAQTIAATHRELFKQAKAAASAHLTCRPTGVQGVTTPKEAVLILQTPKKMAMISQEDREVRHVYMDQSHPKNLRPTYSGHSVGHWEGNELVIDTTGYNGKGQLDEMGNPHSDQLQVAERWTKSEDGNILNATFTITDPVNYTQSFNAKRQYRRTPGMRLLDYDCAENPRSDDFSNLTFEHDWFKPTCVRPVEKGVAADKVECTPRSKSSGKP